MGEKKRKEREEDEDAVERPRKLDIAFKPSGDVSALLEMGRRSVKEARTILKSGPPAKEAESGKGEKHRQRSRSRSEKPLPRRGNDRKARSYSESYSPDRRKNRKD